MNAERILMMIARMVMRGGVQKMARGETAAKPPSKSQLLRQAMRIMRRFGRL